MQLVVRRSLAEVACREVVEIAGQGRHIVLRTEREERRKAELEEHRKIVLEGRHKLAGEQLRTAAADVVEGHHMQSELVVDYMRLSVAVDYIAVLPGATVHSFAVRTAGWTVHKLFAPDWCTGSILVDHTPMADHNQQQEEHHCSLAVAAADMEADRTRQAAADRRSMPLRIARCSCLISDCSRCAVVSAAS